jgi:hypothetical protein
VFPKLKEGDYVLLQDYTVFTDRSLLCALENLGEGTCVIFKGDGKRLDGARAREKAVEKSELVYQEWLEQKPSIGQVSLP